MAPKDPREKQRPTPEALLDEAKRERRGKLKIFLGAYPGVGKTYSMLQAAHGGAARAWMSWSAWSKRMAAPKPRRCFAGWKSSRASSIIYRGRYFGEMDVDALLKRSRQVVHRRRTGAHQHPRQPPRKALSGRRRPARRRYRCVHDAQHSAHREPERRGGAHFPHSGARNAARPACSSWPTKSSWWTCRPTTSCSACARARFTCPSRRRAPSAHFFSKGNLTALRELAMRIAAERVDAQMVNYMRAHAIPGPWPAQDRLLVCLNELPVGEAPRAHRAAHGRARPHSLDRALRAHAALRKPDATRPRTASRETMRLAERLDGEVVTLHVGPHVVDEILAVAEKRNVTRILVGRERSRAVDRIVPRKCGARDFETQGSRFEITVISPEEEDAEQDKIGADVPAARRVAERLRHGGRDHGHRHGARLFGYAVLLLQQRADPARLRPLLVAI